MEEKEMNRKLAGIVFMIVSVLVVSGLSGCNTMRGLGKDIERGGEKIQEATDD